MTQRSTTSLSHAQPHPSLVPAPRTVTLRSASLGLFLVLLTAVLVPYSDNICHSTYLVGNHFPLIMVAAVTLLCVAVNPLMGRRRFQSGELAVAVGMMVAACAIPSSGFLRYFQPMVADTVYFSQETAWYRRYIAALPDWMVPSKNPSDRIIQAFYRGIDPVVGESAWRMWGPWLKVYLGWGLFFGPLIAAVLLVAAILRKQWIVHEKLAFPLASLPLEMMADPEPGRRWNALWRSRSLWVGVAIPFCIHLMNGLAMMWPSVPTFTLHYDLNSAMSEYPWRVLEYSVKSFTIYFSVIGVTYFVPLEIAFSVWFFFLAYQVGKVFFDRSGVAVTGENYTYQGLGVFLAYGVMLLWIARHHLAHVGRSVLVAPFKKEEGEVLPYGVMLGLLVLCVVLAGGVLAEAYGGIGAIQNDALALMVVAMVLFYGMVLTRMVIDAGLLLIQVPAGAEAIRALGMLFHGNKALLSLKQWTVSSFAMQAHLTDQREAMMPFAANALRMGSDVQERRRIAYFLLLLTSMFLAVSVSAGTHHVLTYTYGRQNFDDGHGPERLPRLTMDLSRENAQPEEAKPRINRPLNVAGGAAALATVSALRLMWTGCPLHPIGLLLLNSWAVGVIWFSVLISWLAKWVILRFGGVGAYTRGREFFIGLIVGESLAGVFWVCWGLISPWESLSKAYQVMPH